MSDADDSAPPMSIKDRIAALQKGKGGTSTTIPIGPPPTRPKKSNALTGRIAALQMQSAAEKESSDDKISVDLPTKTSDGNNISSKVGKLKLPPGGLPIIMPGVGPPPSLLRKQKEREERKQKMIEDAQREDAESTENTSTNSSSVGKLKFPPGAIKMMCPPPAMSKTDGGAVEEASNEDTTVATPDDALMSRPTMPKRRPRNRA